MATTTVFGSLSLPAPEDTMEMSSPANRNADDDIDIDFEDYQGGVQLPDDDQMLEDDPTRPATATDDMMEDDVLPGEQVHVEEEIMQDDGPLVEEVQQVEDEELIDYSDDEYEVQEAADVAISPVFEGPPEIVDITAKQATEGVLQENEFAPLEIPPGALIEEVTAESAQAVQPPTNAEDFLAPHASAQDGVNVETVSALADEAHTYEDAGDVRDPTPAQLSMPEDPKQASISVNTTLTTSADTPDTPTDTGLHPMTVRYADLFMPLFKSRRQPEGLLKDDNLANLSLAELIRSCRQQLALRIGEDVSEDQEILLGFGNLGLMLVEDCRAAFESSLNDVLEVYLQLHQNDGAQDIPPLALNLSLQLKFQSSFSILKQAAAGGQGMSTFGFLHSTGDEGADLYQENHEDEEATGLQEPGEAEDGVEEHEYDESAYTEHFGEAAHADTGEDRHGPEEAADKPAEDHHEDYYQDEDYHENLAAATFHPQEPDEATSRPDELQANEDRGGESLYYRPEDEEKLAQIPTTQEQYGPAGEGQGTAQLAESTASSATVQGDLSNTTGEYDEDFIDWDNDSLTSPSSEHPGHGQNDLSAYLEEHDENEPTLAMPAVDPQEVGESTVPLDDSGVAEVTDQTFDAPNYGAEDFLNDLTGQEYYDDAQIAEQDLLEDYGAGEQAEQDEYHYDNQADTFDEQQEEYHPDYQPGEDEQFHTAGELFDDDHYEHGPEDDPNEEEEDFDNTVIHHDFENSAEVEGEENFGDDEATVARPDGGASQSYSTTKGSPLGKRSFVELAELDELEDDEPELKKVRPA